MLDVYKRQSLNSLKIIPAHRDGHAAFVQTRDGEKAVGPQNRHFGTGTNESKRLVANLAGQLL